MRGIPLTRMRTKKAQTHCHKKRKSPYKMDNSAAKVILFFIPAKQSAVIFAGKTKIHS